jgi:hypothetical protein
MSNGYHFCKDCIHSDGITTREEKRDGHTFIVQKCPESNGESWWYKGDYGRILHTCPGFVKSQMELEGL